MLAEIQRMKDEEVELAAKKRVAGKKLLEEVGPARHCYLFIYFYYVHRAPRRFTW
jgi:hypothetical protein